MTDFNFQLSSTNKRWLLALRVLLALIFAAAGMAKLLGVDALVAVFDTIGYGQWLRWFTAIVEITAACLVLLPGSAFAGAALMAGVSFGAVVSQILLIGDSPFPPLVLLVLSGLLAWRTLPDQGETA